MIGTESAESEWNLVCGVDYDMMLAYLVRAAWHHNEAADGDGTQQPLCLVLLCAVA